MPQQLRPEAANANTDRRAEVIREPRPTTEDEARAKAEQILGVAGTLTVRRALQATSGAGDPKELEAALNEKKSRLAQLNDKLETARQEYREAREAFAEVEMADIEGEDVDLEAARSRLKEAKQAREEAEEMFDDRAEMLREAVDRLKPKLKRARVRKAATKARDLNQKAAEKAQEMAEKLREVAELNKEVAELEERAKLTHLDGGVQEFRSLSTTGRPDGLDLPPLSFSALDEEDRHHTLRQLDSVEAFLKNSGVDVVNDYANQ